MYIYFKVNFLHIYMYKDTLFRYKAFLMYFPDYQVLVDCST